MLGAVVFMKLLHWSVWVILYVSITTIALTEEGIHFEMYVIFFPVSAEEESGMSLLIRGHPDLQFARNEAGGGNEEKE